MTKNWNIATLQKRTMIADDVMSLIFTLQNPISFESGQHMDIRLTAGNGYQAERSYSIANAPEQKDFIELGVQILPGGEVSPYLSTMKIGGQIEVRGPIGNHFIWNTNISGPLILIGGGSGMVPLMSMLRHHMNNLEKDSDREIYFIISARTLGHILYKEELMDIAARDTRVKIIQTITDKAPDGWTGYARRVDRKMLDEITGHLANQETHTYICGPNPFVATVSNEIVKMGFDPKTVKTERFGG